MEEISDEELNQLLKGSEDSQDISSFENSWKKLEYKLNQRKVQKTYRRYLLFFIFLGAVSLLVILNLKKLSSRTGSQVTSLAGSHKRYTNNEKQPLYEFAGKENHYTEKRKVSEPAGGTFNNSKEARISSNRKDNIDKLITENKNQSANAHEHRTIAAIPRDWKMDEPAKNFSNKSQVIQLKAGGKKVGSIKQFSQLTQPGKEKFIFSNPSVEAQNHKKEVPDNATVQINVQKSSEKMSGQKKTKSFPSGSTNLYGSEISVTDYSENGFSGTLKPGKEILFLNSNLTGGKKDYSNLITSQNLQPKNFDPILIFEANKLILPHDSLILKSADSLLLPIADSKNLKAQKKNRNRRRYSLAVVASPDFSSTSFFKLGKPGYIIGMLAEYHVNAFLTMQTGVLRSSKIYSSKGGYHSNESYWILKDKASRIDGSCTIIDVPLNFKFNILGNSQKLIFISTGISSYLMEKERYSFVFSSTNSEKSWQHDKNTNYLFGVLNVSAGVERALTEQLSFQAEPFFKIPLKFVGDGKAELLTSGVIFGLKYNIR